MKSGLKVKARVGKISYINCVPFYHNLVQAKEDFPLDIEYYEEVPSKLNRAMQDKKIDIGPVSSLEYLNHQKDYILLPELSIGSRDFSGSVLLISKEKIEGLNGACVAVSKASLSSTTLLKILLKFKYKFENSFVGMDPNPTQMLKKHPAALLIGDDALFYTPDEFVYKYDLSELWWNWTEKPFCFALWAVRREFAKEYPEELAAFFWKLRKNLDRNLADIQTLMKNALRLSFMDERFPKIFGYLFNLSYGLDDSMQEGLGLFYRLAKRLGISPVSKKFDFLKIQ